MVEGSEVVIPGQEKVCKSFSVLPAGDSGDVEGDVGDSGSSLFLSLHDVI